MSLTDSVLRTIRRHDMLPAGGRVAVALSGGPDSVALLHLLRELENRGELVVAGRRRTSTISCAEPRPTATRRSAGSSRVSSASRSRSARRTCAARPRAEKRSIEDAARSAALRVSRCGGARAERRRRCGRPQPRRPGRDVPAPAASAARGRAGSARSGRRPAASFARCSRSRRARTPPIRRRRKVLPSGRTRPTRTSRSRATVSGTSCCPTSSGNSRRYRRGARSRSRAAPRTMRTSWRRKQSKWPLLSSYLTTASVDGSMTRELQGAASGPGFPGGTRALQQLAGGRFVGFEHVQRFLAFVRNGAAGQAVSLPGQQAVHQGAMVLLGPEPDRGVAVSNLQRLSLPVPGEVVLDSQRITVSAEWTRWSRAGRTRRVGAGQGRDRGPGGQVPGAQVTGSSRPGWAAGARSCRTTWWTGKWPGRTGTACRWSWTATIGSYGSSGTQWPRGFAPRSPHPA